MPSVTQADPVQELARAVRTDDAAGVRRLLQEHPELRARLDQALPDEAFGLPGGEGDWTVAEAVGHVAASRAGLVLAASLAAAGRWPEGAPTVVPGIPGDAHLDRGDLVRKLGQSQRVIDRSARQIAGHETDPCPLDHPLVGRLRCGEWVLFAGVHDVMHLEQLHGIAAALAAPSHRLR